MAVLTIDPAIASALGGFGSTALFYIAKCFKPSLDKFSEDFAGKISFATYSALQNNLPPKLKSFFDAQASSFNGSSGETLNNLIPDLEQAIVQQVVSSPDDAKIIRDFFMNLSVHDEQFKNLIEDPKVSITQPTGRLLVYPEFGYVPAIAIPKQIKKAYGTHFQSVVAMDEINSDAFCLIKASNPNDPLEEIFLTPGELFYTGVTTPSHYWSQVLNIAGGKMPRTLAAYLEASGNPRKFTSEQREIQSAFLEELKAWPS